MNINDLQTKFKYKNFEKITDEEWVEFNLTPELILDQKFLSLFKDKINWYNVVYLLKNEELKESIKIIETFWKNIITYKSNISPIVLLCKLFNLSECFLFKHRKDLSWITICQYQKLTEKFISKMLQKQKKENKTYIFWYCFNYNTQIQLSGDFLSKNNKIKNKQNNEFIKQIQEQNLIWD